MRKPKTVQRRLSLSPSIGIYRDFAATYSLFLVSAALLSRQTHWSKPKYPRNPREFPLNAACPSAAELSGRKRKPQYGAKKRGASPQKPDILKHLFFIVLNIHAPYCHFLLALGGHLVYCCHVSQMSVLPLINHLDGNRSSSETSEKWTTCRLKDI